MDVMNRIKNGLIFGILGSWVVITAALCWFMMPSASYAQAPSEALKLILTTDKPKVLLGEPVYVIVQLANVGARPVEVFKNLDPEVGALEVEITGPQGIFGFVPYAVADTDIKLETLAPRADVTAVVAIFYGGRGWTFTQAGNYTITALYRNPLDRSANPVRSNPLSISVALGNGAGEFLIKDDAGEEAGKFLLWQQGDHLRKGIRRLTDLIERYPDSPLADYAQLALGLNLSRAFKDYSIGQVRKPDYELARRYLQKVQPTRLPINLQVENTLAQARSAGKLGHTDEARRLVQQAKQLAGDRPYLLSRFEEILSRTPELR